MEFIEVPNEKAYCNLSAWGMLQADRLYTYRIAEGCQVFPDSEQAVPSPINPEVELH